MYTPYIDCYSDEKEIVISKEKEKF